MCSLRPRGIAAKGALNTMGIEVHTKDCTALGDADFAEMADLSTQGAGWEVGLLSKQAEEWVLVTQAYDDAKLKGFIFSTLERVGGTPALAIGLGCVGPTRNRSSVLKGLMHDQLHKTFMAFPDEDVVVATRINGTGPLEAMVGLQGVRPWPETRPNGEERAWGRRLAKRFGATGFDDRSMVATGDGNNLVFDYASLKKSKNDAIFADCSRRDDQHVVVWGWAMAEYLEEFELSAS